MQQGRFDQAAAVLHDVLKKMRSSSCYTGDKANKQEDSGSIIAIESVPVSQGQSGAFHIYARAFTFNDNDASCDDVLVSSQQALATLFYNLALVQHLRALQCDRLQQRRLSFSKMLYIRAFQCLLRCRDGSFKQLKLAIFNNKAHIHSAFFERKGMQQCFHHMKALLRDTEEEECVGEIHMNILLFNVNMMSAPAA
jgi:hypothetical protein